MPAFIDLTKQKFNRLTVLERIKPNYPTKWKCRCDCGNITFVTSGGLKTGNTQSCGCLNKELAAKRVSTHGMSKSSEYRSWSHMKGRCYNPTDTFYKNYGGRGITICEEWRKSFSAFYKYMGTKPHKTDSIDRINNAGNYEPGNVRWADRKTQNNNKKTNHFITINGTTKSIAQWAKTKKVPQYLITNRLRRGWSPQDAVIKKNYNYSRPVTVNRVTKTAVQWSKITGIRSSVINKRLRRGWSPEDAISLPLQQ